jgi:hypothetical protein
MFLTHLHLLEDTTMLKPSRSHPDYVAFVQHKLTEGKVPEPLRHWLAKDKLRLLDLTSAFPILATLYAQTGRPGIPPEDLLRSLIAMTLCDVTSVDLWVDKMREHPPSTPSSVGSIRNGSQASAPSTTSWTACSA